MKDSLEKRLSELISEFESGKKALSDLEIKQNNLRNTLLRISGAIQVLEEELVKWNNEKKDMPKQQLLSEQFKSFEVEQSDTGL